MWGLVLSGLIKPLSAFVSGVASPIPIFVIQTRRSRSSSRVARIHGRVASNGGLGSFGVADALYTVAWGVGRSAFGLPADPVRTDRLPGSDAVVVASSAALDVTGRTRAVLGGALSGYNDGEDPRIRQRITRISTK